jgi:Tol biopolymer transport system component
MRIRTRPLTSAVGLLVVALLALQAPVEAGTAVVPRVAYSGGKGRVATAKLDGTVVRRFAGYEPMVSISGGTLAVSRWNDAHRRADVLGFDARTGTLRFAIRDATFPLIARDGRVVVFLPDQNGRKAPTERDPSVNSVWLRRVATGEEIRLVRFRNGDRVPLHLALSPKGSKVAVAEGNDVDLFESDLFVARTDVHEVKRLTNDGASWYPSFSPNGSTLAFTHEVGSDLCTAGIDTIGADGTGQTTVAAGSCSQALLRPLWLDADTLVAWWWAQAGTGFEPEGLVTVEVGTGTVSPLIAGPIVDYSLSRPLHRIAYRLDSGSVRIYDLDTSTTTPVAGGRFMLGSRVWLDGSLELAY